MVSEAGFNSRCPSLSPWRAEHTPAISSDLVTLFSTTNDGRGGRPNWAGVLAVYQPKSGSAGAVSNEKQFVRATVMLIRP